MKMPHFLNEEKYIPVYAGLAVLLLVGGAALWHVARETEAACASLSAANDMLEAYGKMERPGEARRVFWKKLLGRVDMMSYVPLLEGEGLTVEEVSESEEPAERGDFHKIRLSGTGSFSQIVRGFVIIGSKDEWNAVNLLNLSRAGGMLRYEVEISTFQARGNNDEEEKYRPHRTHGDRQEPGREDYR